MSQLDISIPFNQFVTIVVFMYFYIFYVIITLRNYFYNQKSRALNSSKREVDSNKLNNIVWLKRILKF